MFKLGFSDELWLRMRVEAPNGLWRGAGVHRLRFPLFFDASPAVRSGLPVAVTAHVWLGSNRQDWLGVATLEQPVTASRASEKSGGLVLALSDEQLAVIEQRRAKQDLALDLEVHVVFTPDEFPADEDAFTSCQSFGHMVHVQSGAWIRLLQQASAGMSLAIVVPVSLAREGKSLAAGRRLRDALELVDQGSYDAAVIAARKAIEEFGRHPGSLKRLAEKRPEDRTLSDRLDLLEESLFSVASAAAHTDAVVADVVWTRELALAVIAGISAWLAVQHSVTRPDESTTTRG